MEVLQINKSQTKHLLKFSISDTGCGISKNKHKLIFERFFRVDYDRNQKIGGSGLGLAISKKSYRIGGKIMGRRGAKLCFVLLCMRYIV